MKYLTNFMFQELANKFSANSKEYKVYIANFPARPETHWCSLQQASKSVRTEQFYSLTNVKSSHL